jgi:hypothetical protein
LLITLDCFNMFHERKTTFLMQSHLIKTLEETFGGEVDNLSEYGTPGTPEFKIVRPGDDIERTD